MTPCHPPRNDPGDATGAPQGVLLKGELEADGEELWGSVSGIGFKEDDAVSVELGFWRL